MKSKFKQLNSIILKDVADFIAKRLDRPGFIFTLNNVTLSDNGKLCLIEYQIYPSNADIKFLHKFLLSNRVKIQNLVSKNHNLRTTPIIKYKLVNNDDSLSKIGILFNQIKK